MNIYENYKEIQCIEKMSEDYKKRFFRIVEEYAPRLSEQIVLEGSAYTLHDFNHHCVNIYKNISDIILNDKIVYERNGLQQKELYILNLAVLFHDIGMTTYIESKRDNHSNLSAIKVQELYDNEESLYSKQVNLTNQENKVLLEIIKAHSDIKDGTVDESERGLNNPRLSNSMARSIRGKLLACILRLADEMDVTVDRIGTTSIEKNLHNIESKLNIIKRQKKTEDENVNLSTEIEISRLEKLVESLAHWKRLRLFSELKREPESDEVNLVINDDYITQCRIDGETYESLAEEIVYTYKKIRRELEGGLKEKINSEVQRLNLKTLIAINKITLFTEIKELEREIQNKLIDNASVSDTNVLVQDEYKRTIKSDEINVKDDNHRLPMVVNDEFALKFTDIVKKRRLIKVGHFILNNTYCARDWIDTTEIVETQGIMDEMVFNIVKNINSDLMNKYKNFGSKCLIVGLDLEGAVIAARVAMALQMSFSYIIPTKELDHCASKENEFQFEQYDKLVLITDAIVTYETINTSLQYINILEKDYDKIERIYTMFYRDSIYKPVEVGRQLMDKTYCICNCFNIELFEKSKCTYKNRECFGENI